MKTKMIKKIKNYAMGTKTFWRLYFWWGIREAGKRRRERERQSALRPRMTHDEYWESKRK